MGSQDKDISVLLIGAGVIGSIYAGQLALGGCQVWVLDHGEHEREIAGAGIRLHDADANTSVIARMELARTAAERTYQLVIVAVQAEQLPSTFPILRTLKGSPHIIFFGNNPSGHSLIPRNLPGDYELAFPGVAGSVKNGGVRYVHVSQQPTTFQISDNIVSKTVQTILESRGFPIERTANMDGWLAYHAVFIACMLTALQIVANDSGALGRNRKLLRLLCRAVEEGFAALRSQDVGGVPRALSILHLPILRPVAVHYWGKIMRSGRGELYFAAHARHAPEEVEALRQWTLSRIDPSRRHVGHLKELLEKPTGQKLP